MSDWLDIHEGKVPLIITFPHSGTELPSDAKPSFASSWLARKDTDWWIDRLYGFAVDIGATTVRTRVSRSIIDANRDPSGASLYPGQATTELCPTVTFDGEPLYADELPATSLIAERRAAYFEPYHDAIVRQIKRLGRRHPRVVLYDAHSIRSRIPRLFADELPIFNIGTNSGASCDPALAAAVEEICVATGYPTVMNGRFKGGWTTRHYGMPGTGVHALQMELAIRGYLTEPQTPSPDNWPGAFDPQFAAPLSATLQDIAKACIAFARS